MDLYANFEAIKIVSTWNWINFYLNIFFSLWAQENPRWVGAVNEVGPEKIMAWAGIVGTHIIGPFFFDANVTGETYLDMLLGNILPALHRNGFDSQDICYMHDGAPAHITADVRQCLDDSFHSWIGRGNGTGLFLNWPPRSPDLNMLDFFLWGVLQHRVFIQEHASIEDLSNAITNEIDDISPNVLARVQQNLLKRLRKCIEVKGQLFEHLLK